MERTTFVVTVTENEDVGFTAEITQGDTKVIDSIYGDTLAEAAMTAVYNGYQDEASDGQNGWVHEG